MQPDAVQAEGMGASEAAAEPEVAVEADGAALTYSSRPPPPMEDSRRPCRPPNPPFRGWASLYRPPQLPPVLGKSREVGFRSVPRISREQSLGFQGRSLFSPWKTGPRKSAIVGGVSG